MKHAKPVSEFLSQASTFCHLVSSASRGCDYPCSALLPGSRYTESCLKASPFLPHAPYSPQHFLQPHSPSTAQTTQHHRNILCRHLRQQQKHRHNRQALWNPVRHQYQLKHRPRKRKECRYRRMAWTTEAKLCWHPWSDPESFQAD